MSPITRHQHPVPATAPDAAGGGAIHRLTTAGPPHGVRRRRPPLGVPLALAVLGSLAILAVGAAPAAPTPPASAPTAAALAAHAPAQPAAAHAGFSLDDKASFSERRNARGGRDWRVIEPRFTVTPVVLLPERRQVDMLLVQRLDSTSHSDAEGSESTLQVSGWVAGTARFDRRLWRFTDEADEGGMARYRNFYQATKHGCCGSEVVHDDYSLATGRLIGAATAEALATVQIPNTPTWRMISYHGDNGARPPALPRGTAAIPDLLGVLSLASDQGFQHRVAVTAAGIEAWTPTLKLRLDKGGDETDQLDLWAADKNPAPAGMTGFQVRLFYLDTKLVVIPVAADDFDLAHATLPAGFHLTRLAAEKP